MYKNRKLNF